MKNISCSINKWSKGSGDQEDPTISILVCNYHPMGVKWQFQGLGNGLCHYSVRTLGLFITASLPRILDKHWGELETDCDHPPWKVCWLPQQFVSMKQEASRLLCVVVHLYDKLKDVVSEKKALLSVRILKITSTKIKVVKRIGASVLVREWKSLCNTLNDLNN